MSTYIKSGFWTNSYKSYKNWLDLDFFIKKIINKSLLENAGFVGVGQLTIYKHPLNNLPANANILQIKDVGVGFFANGTFMPFGMYLGGDPTIVGSWDTGVMFTS